MGRATPLTNTHVHGWWFVGAGAINIELGAAELTFWTLLAAAFILAAAILRRRDVLRDLRRHRTVPRTYS